MSGAARSKKILAVVGVVLVAAAVVFFLVHRGKSRAIAEVHPPLRASSTPTAVLDPLAPERPLRIAGPRADAPGIRGAGSGAEWVSKPPLERLRREKPPSERGGIDPCDAPDPGFEGYSRWKPVSSGALYLLPEQSPFDAEGGFDLVMHFHGHDLARKGFVRAGAQVVLYGRSFGTGGAYRSRISGPQALDHLIAAVEAALGEQRDGPVKVKRLAVTAWSAGYEAVGCLLESDPKRIDAVVLLDGLHASRVPEKMGLQLAPFSRYAERAARGDAFMLVTHSSIEPGSYASSTETAHHLIDHVGGRPLEARRLDALGLELIEAFSQGNFHVRGYAGGGEADHCAHLALMEDAVRAIAKRWKP